MDTVQINRTAMPVLYFVFFQLLKGIKIDTTLRVSLWLDGKNKYLMPCQFIEVLEEDNFYMVKAEVLDLENFVNEKLLEQKFLFGHPGKIIGYGLLKEIS
jgi:hypothetical protein